MLGDFAGAMGGGNDLGNLADELAEAWDEDGEGEEEVLGLQMDEQGDHTPFETFEVHHQGDGIILSPAHGRTVNGGSSPKKVTEQYRVRRRRRDLYGSDYSDDSDPEQAPNVSRALEARLATIEGLARQEPEEHEENADGMVQRVVDGLRDLGAQSSVENGITRSVLLMHDSYNPRPHNLNRNL